MFQTFWSSSYSLRGTLPILSKPPESLLKERCSSSGLVTLSAPCCLLGLNTFCRLCQPYLHPVHPNAPAATPAAGLLDACPTCCKLAMHSGSCSMATRHAEAIDQKPKMQHQIATEVLWMAFWPDYHEPKCTTRLQQAPSCSKAGTRGCCGRLRAIPFLTLWPAPTA